MNLHLYLLLLLLKFIFLNHRQPQYGIPMCYFSGQTVTPTNTNPIMSIPSSANISRTNELVPHVSLVPPRSYVRPIGPISDEMFDRYMQRWQNRQRLISPTSQYDQNGSPHSQLDRSRRSVRPVTLFQTNVRCLHPHSQILQVILIKCLMIIRMIWLTCL